MHSRVTPNLSRGHEPFFGVYAQTQDVIGVGRVIALLVCRLVIDDAQSSHMVDNFTGRDVVEVTTAVIPSISVGGGGGGGSVYMCKREGEGESWLSPWWKGGDRDGERKRR